MRVRIQALERNRRNAGDNERSLGSASAQQNARALEEESKLNGECRAVGMTWVKQLQEAADVGCSAKKTGLADARHLDRASWLAERTRMRANWSLLENDRSPCRRRGPDMAESSRLSGTHRSESALSDSAALRRRRRMAARIRAHRGMRRRGSRLLKILPAARPSRRSSISRGRQQLGTAARARARIAAPDGICQDVSET